MRISDIRLGVRPISRYADDTLPSGGLDTSIVALVTDVVRDGRPVVGYGFGSIGRFAQDGLIRERFAPRLLAVTDGEIATPDGGNIDPFAAWTVMMRDEKPGGHGERCVAVGTLDMALWDAAAKIAGMPLHRYIAETVPDVGPARDRIPVYAGGGYYYPGDDRARLRDEVSRLVDAGYTRVKIKVSARGLREDLSRIETAASCLAGVEYLAVDAIYGYDADTALRAADAFAPYGLWWFEDICDPHDFETQAAVAARYAPPIAAGESLFSQAEARLLALHGGLRQDRDILLFDPVHCYGLPGYLGIVRELEGHGWGRSSFWPHGGHLFTLHLVAALGLGGAEVNPLNFQPFGGLPDGCGPQDGMVAPPDAPGIGFETKAALRATFDALLDG